LIPKFDDSTLPNFALPLKIGSLALWNFLCRAFWYLLFLCLLLEEEVLFEEELEEDDICNTPSIDIVNTEVL
jgi:hypothetical protein